MKKFDRMEAFVEQLPTGDAGGLHPCYAGYFACFNRGEYYEAHDVLEHLWLQCADANALFYKGLIQLAGGFVHLRKQFEHPTHAKHGRRLAPAARLFDLAAANLAPFAPHHHHLDVDLALALARDTAGKIRATDYTENPWSPATAPTLQPDPEIP
jgi:hypothetical protein